MNKANINILPSTLYPRPYTLNPSQGFTIVELLIVIGLIAILLGIGVLMGYDSITRSSVAGERDLFVSLLTGTRAKAIANVNESRHGLRVEEEQYVLFELAEGEDDFGDSNSDTHREIPRNENVVITGPEDVDVPFELIFEQLSADVLEDNGVGTITLSGNGQSGVVEVNEFGRIEW